MPLAYACLLPHSPVLLPGIAPSHGAELKKTLEHCRQIGSELIAAEPDIIITLSPHGVVQDKAFTINTAMRFASNFTEFGDLGTKQSRDGDLSLADQLIGPDFNFPVEAISSPVLDYGSAVSLTFLPESKAKLLPIYTSNLSLSNHFLFGQKLGELIKKQDKPIALVASGDLSHRLNRRSPAGYSPKAKWFDKRVIKALETKKIDELINLDKALLDNVEECGLKPILILLGAMSTMSLSAEIVGYDYPMGIGWVTARFKFIPSNI
ncbi:MAG: AmmeMemoRadiSam system protein B [Candidatus Falkowbacteria bacterium]